MFINYFSLCSGLKYVLLNPALRLKRSGELLSNPEDACGHRREQRLSCACPAFEEQLRSGRWHRSGPMEARSVQ